MERIAHVAFAIVDRAFDFFRHAHPLRDVAAGILVVPAPLFGASIFTIIEMVLV